jgi:apolipoprotein D and lipocalin family protein
VSVRCLLGNQCESRYHSILVLRRRISLSLIKTILLCSFLALFTGCVAQPAPTTVRNVVLTRYAGRWYEISRLPQFFERNCAGVTADYTLNPNGTVRVVNTCRQSTVEGPQRQIKGTARSTNPPDNSRLKVTFFWPFAGDYWIFRLNDDYTTAAVGSPDRKSLWILHRQPHMDPAEYENLIASLRVDGFPVDRLEHTPQK